MTDLHSAHGSQSIPTAVALGLTNERPSEVEFHALDLLSPAIEAGSKLSVPQQRFVQDISTTNVLLAGGYGSGKTYALCAKMLYLCAANAGEPVGLVGATWKQMKRDVIPILLGMLKRAGLPYRYHRTDATIKSEGVGLCVQLASAEDPDSMKGANWAAAGMNEPGIMRAEAWEATISRVRVGGALPQKVLAGTPEGFNWLYDVFVEKQKANHRVIRTKTSDNPVITTEYVESLYDAFDERLVAEKVLGHFVNVQGSSAYYNFQRQVHVRDLVVDPELPFFIAIDFNINPFIALIGQQVGLETRFLDQIVLEGARTREMAKALRAYLGDRIDAEEVPVYPDASGKSGRTSSDSSDFEILNEFGFTDIRCPAANPPVRDRVNAFNGRLRNARDVVQVAISPRCYTLVRDLEQVVWRGDDLDKRNKRLTHASDAAGYYLHFEFPVGGARQGGIACR